MHGNVKRRHPYIVTVNNDVVRSTDTTRIWKRKETALYPKGFLILCWIISRVSNGLSTNPTLTYLASQFQEQYLICMKIIFKTKWSPFLQHHLHGPCRLLVGLRTQMWRSSWAIVIHPKTTLCQERSYTSHSVILGRLLFRMLRVEKAFSSPRRILFHAHLPAQVQSMTPIVVLPAIRLAYLFSQRQKHIVEYPLLRPLRAHPINLLRTPAKWQWRLTMSCQRCKTWSWKQPNDRRSYLKDRVLVLRKILKGMNFDPTTGNMCTNERCVPLCGLHNDLIWAMAAA